MVDEPLSPEISSSQHHHNRNIPISSPPHLNKMDERAQIPVTLPRPNPTTSYWQDPPDPFLANHRTTPDLPSSADIVIIGSGITGASIAWHLLSTSTSTPPPTILMLEARQTCSGATGRNGNPP